MVQQTHAVRRVPLSRDRVLRTAVALADDVGIESLNMRRLAQELGVVPMALYKHVANKDELLDGMVDVVVGQIHPPVPGAEWKNAVRQRILSARRALLAHRWAARVIQARANPTPAVLDYMDSLIGMFRIGGLSADLTHHAMHALGSRMLGFTQDLFNDTPSVDPDVQTAMLREMAERRPYLTEMASAATHDDESIIGSGCDDQFEFEFALDILLDGFERLQQRARTSTDHARANVSARRS